MDLGKRLTKVANLVQPVPVMADVGCDHGYLSIYLAEQKRCQRIIAMDINKGPLQKAEENIRKFGYDGYIETRLSNGLNELKYKEADGYVCAGMGGPLALQIMWNDRDKVREMKQIILQPQSELWLVRRTLKQWGFVIEKEDVEFEDGKYYFMMRIRPGDCICMEEPPQENTLMAEGNTIEEAACELFAEELLKERNELLREYISKEEKRLSDIYESLRQQEESPKCRNRLETIERELAIHQWALARYETQ